MGLLDPTLLGNLNKLKGLLGETPIGKYVRGQDQGVSVNGLKQALLGTPVFDQQAAMRDMQYAADAIGPTAIAGTLKMAKGMTKFERAHQIAQKNAVEMLGLPPNNTAADRAKALGFMDREVYHGTSADIAEFDPSRLGSNTGNSGANGPGTYVSELPWHSELYAGGAWGKSEGANLMPLKMRMNDQYIWDGTKEKLFGGNTVHPREAKWWESGKDGAIVYRPGIKGNKAEIIEAAVAAPQNLRSRFAAFDPKRKDEADLLAAYFGFPIAREDEDKRVRNGLLGGK